MAGSGKFHKRSVYNKQQQPKRNELEFPKEVRNSSQEEGGGGWQDGSACESIRQASSEEQAAESKRQASSEEQAAESKSNFL